MSSPSTLTPTQSCSKMMQAFKSLFRMGRATSKTPKRWVRSSFSASVDTDGTGLASAGRGGVAGAAVGVLPVALDKE